MGNNKNKMMDKEEVEKLNKFQHTGRYHPYTCCGYLGCKREIDSGILIATEQKWVCPCSKYEQSYDDSDNMKMELMDRISKDTYNKEIDAAVERVRNGKSVSNDDVFRELE